LLWLKSRNRFQFLKIFLRIFSALLSAEIIVF
jgi:hypothetical protein